MFFDSEEDASSSIAATFGDNVSVFHRTSSLLDKQSQMCSIYQDVKSFLHDEVPARQMLNAQYASILATEMGFSWLLHIDIDEVFFCPPPLTVKDHFESVSSQDVVSVVYMNHEGVPESFDSADYFKDITLFKRHHYNISMSADAERGIGFWTNRTTHRQYMLVYDNGKSSIRLRCPDGSDGFAIPQDVHRWNFVSTSKPQHRWTPHTTFLDPRNLHLKRTDTGSESLQMLEGQQPCILHYVTCGFSWLVAKYRILGRFPDYWFGGKLPMAKSFHSDARDIISGSDSGVSADLRTISCEKSKSLERAANFYLSQVCLLCSPELNITNAEYEVDLASVRERHVVDSVLNVHRRERDCQLRSGVLMRVELIANILRMLSEKGNPVDMSELRHVAAHAIHEIPIDNIDSNYDIDKPSGYSHSASVASGDLNYQSLSDMNKLRIISQSAFAFL